MNFPKYPEYRDLGIEWLGDLPAHWDVLPGRRLLSNVRETAEPDSEQLAVTQSCGVVPQKKFMEERGQKVVLALAGTENFKKVRQNDFVISLRSFQGGIEHSAFDGCVSPAYTVLRPNEKKAIDSHYFKYFLKASEFIGALQSVTTGIREGKTITYDQFASIPLPIAPLTEQKRITAFLDHETARIDALIEEQRCLIELLKEKRQAVISHAVTKGLDPDVPMKDSGVEWLGEVPAYWKTGSLKHALEAVADVDHYMPASVDSGIPYVMTGDLCRLVSEIQLSLCKQISREDFLKLTRKIRTSKGDVIMARYATIGSVSYVDIDAEFVISYSCVTIRPKPKLATGFYLFFYFQSDAFIQGISNMINANTQENVGIADLREVKVALPDIHEQKKIVEDLEPKLSDLDRITKNSTATIRLLQERRSALISAAVTGKIDVRDWQPPAAGASVVAEASQTETA